VWITSDGGQSWQPANDIMANLAVCCMVMDPTSASAIYAGTGEGYYNGDAIRGNGIFKTSGGWVEQLASTKDNTDFRWVNGLTINNDASILLAGTREGIFSSRNGGTRFDKKLTCNVGNLMFNPSDKTKAIAGMLQGGGIYYSTNGGDSWSPATTPLGTGQAGRIQVCYAAQNSSTVYASVETIWFVGPDEFRGSEIWVSTNGGQTFAKRDTLSGGNPLDYLSGQGWYGNIIWAGDPTNANLVIVGGLDLWKSTDGGNTLSQISDWRFAPRSAHADHHMIVAASGYNGTSNKSAYFGNDGGLYMTADVTTVGTNNDHTNGWSFLGTKLPITQFFSGAGNSITQTIVAGAQDNGTLRYTPAAGANNWNSMYGGDGGSVASDPTNTNYYFGEYVYLRIFRNTDGGATTGNSDYICGTYYDFGQKKWLWKPAPYSIPDAQTNTGALFIAPMVLDPNDANRLLGGGQSLWLTTDPLAANSSTSGPTWTAIKSALPPAKISAIAVAPGNSDLVLVGYDSGRIDKSTNATSATPTWTRIDDNGIGASRLCTWLTIDANDNDRFYATFGGFQANNVWTSPDSGANWSNIAGGLPEAPVRCVTIHPQNPQWIYIGSEVGVFSSENRGQNWGPANEGATNCVIYQLFWLDNTLYCASHGRGMFSIDLTIHPQAALVVTADLNGNLTAFNGQTGATISSYAMPSGQITAAPLVDGRVVYCGYAQPFAIAKFADANGLSSGPAWQTTLRGSVNATPDLVKATYQGDKDLLYTMAADGKLYVLDSADGSQQWSLQVVPSGRVGTGVNAFSNRVMNQWVYIATDQGLYAVNTQTRTVGWSKDIVCQVPPLLASNTVFAPTQSGKIYALDSRTGAEKWSYDTGAVVASTPVWMLGSIIAGNQSGTLVGLDYATGAVQFTTSFAGEQIGAIIADGTELYFVGNAVNGHLYAYQLNISGATRTIGQTWSVALALGASYLPPVVGTSLYVTTTDANIVAFNTGNGSRNWAKTLAAMAMGAPALVYA
jgi:outer membrane protein assembly factor BamB